MRLRTRARRAFAGVVGTALILATLGVAPGGEAQALGSPLPLTPSLAQVPGVTADYALSTLDGVVERWNPCDPIGYRVDSDLVGDQAIAQVQAAILQLSYVSGLTFEYLGTTDYTPQPGHNTQPAPLVITFSHAKGEDDGSGYLAGGLQLGYGGYISEYSSSGGKVTSDRIRLGFAVIDATQYEHLTPDVQRSLLLHELGHTVGLNHAKDPAELMYPIISSSSPSSYAAGDIRGLRKVGATTACQ